MAATRSATKEAEKALEKALKKRETENTLLAYCESMWRGHGATPLTQIEVDHYINRAQTIYNDYHGTYLNILNCDPTNMVPHEADWKSFIQRFETLTCGLKSLITPAAQSTSTNTAKAEIRLPRMELPSFSGDITEWTSFVDQFDAAVHNNQKISNSQKMTYLKSSIKGEAAKLLTHLCISDTNYDIAWKTLKGRYENEREMVFAVLSRFFGQPVIKEESAAALRALLDVSRECIRRLEKQQLPVDQWDVILVFVMLQRTDSKTRHHWELSSADTDLPKLEKFLDFLELRSRALAAGATCKTNQVKSVGDGQSSKKKVYSHHGNGAKCDFCSGLHYNYRCPDFVKLDIVNRKELIKRTSLCFNCLREGHQTSNCTTASRCKVCKSKHHTMIHDPKPQTQSESRSNQPGQNSTTEPPPQPSVQARTLAAWTQSSTISSLSQSEDPSLSTCSLYTKNSHGDCDSTQPKLVPGLLATALVKLTGFSNIEYYYRALLDPGSTISFITESAVKLLGLKKIKTSVMVTGIGGSNCGTSSAFVSASIHPHFSKSDDKSYNVNFLVRKMITANLPLNSYSPDTWPHILGLNLADPDFHKPGQIDILLGTDIVWDLILDGKIHGPPGTPSACHSALGWLIAGNLGEELSPVLTHHANINLDARLQQFWELENVPSAKLLTKEELQCEQHFVSTFRQDDHGRFIVSLPFKSAREDLGASREIAMRRLKSLERRLAGQPERRQQYIDFMREYESLGHMRIIPPEELHINTEPKASYYIPHHFVLKDVSNVKKFRVVFDASSKTTTGVSLNDNLMVGPTIQDTLVNILTKFRRHVIAFTADIAKMYRQVLMSSDDCDWQRILWREGPHEQIKDYRLLTVTYGTASAPFQATRALYQLAMNQQHSHPLASKVLMDDFYVDDLMTGHDTVEQAINLKTDLVKLTESVGFHLTKWISNDPALVSPSCTNSVLDSQQQVKLDRDDSTKTLGVYWNPVRDTFVFKVSLPQFDPKFTITKRALLSEMSMVFDPLGWLSPVTIRAKILFQRTWKANLGWDDPLPNDIQQEWLTYRENLNSIESCEVKRCIYPPGTTNVSLHGFCDASEQAYSAVVYLRAEHQDNPPLISLIMAKTRVAPAKQVSLPRLELCGALHLSKLLESVQTCLKLQGHETFAWSDSTVVLDWINSQPHRWKTFVANRVAEIQTGVPTTWCHVKGVENPADCASRGIDPTELQHHPLWWHGPDWLSDMALIPQPWKSTLQGHSDDVTMAQEQRVVLISTEAEASDGLVYSFPQQFKGKVKSLPWSIDARRIRPCTDSLGEERPIHRIPRVGGRLRHSMLDANRKHPILLPRHHHLTRLIIIHHHVRNFHAGCQLTLSTISQRFWILGARDAIRQQIKLCITCTSLRGSTMQQMMADLPADRVTPTRAFYTTGVDYAGPFILKPMSTRSKTTMKAYMALFICFVTRAIHLELVSSLTTEAFLAALKRFVGRRGRPSTIYSDCGTNFIGASRELKQLLALVISPQHNEAVAAYLATDGIKWKFNPPGAPHFGGLWEAGVKSVKHHLYRTIGSTRQTFEELSTILVQVESCLNSRPLTPCSTDPNDLTALTPGHFLIGTELNAIPEPDLTSLKVNRLSRWQLNQSIVQHFWQRWSKEYLARLQQRPKWLHHRSDVKIGDMVLIKMENLPPLKWKLGRVIAVHPGPDGIIRVATIKTAEGELKRPIVKLSLLPMDTSVSLSESDSFNHL